MGGVGVVIIIVVATAAPAAVVGTLVGVGAACGGLSLRMVLRLRQLFFYGGGGYLRIVYRQRVARHLGSRGERKPTV